MPNFPFRAMMMLALDLLEAERVRPDE